MDVIVSYLEEYTAGVGQEFPDQEQALQHGIQVGVDSVAVGVPEGLDGGRVAHRNVGFSVGGVEVVGGGLEVGAEPDPVGRVEVDHLHFPGHLLAGDQRGHHPSRFSVDQPVLPVVSVPVVLEDIPVAGQSVVVVEQVERRSAVGGLELLQKSLGMDFFPDRKHRRIVAVFGFPIPGQHRVGPGTPRRLVADLLHHRGVGRGFLGREIHSVGGVVAIVALGAHRTPFRIRSVTARSRPASIRTVEVNSTNPQRRWGREGVPATAGIHQSVTYRLVASDLSSGRPLHSMIR